MFRFWIFIMLYGVFTAHALADEKTKVNDAELYRVDDGVFQLKENESVDITDRFLLLALLRSDKCLVVTLNGRESNCIEVGQRFDLKLPNGPFHLGKLFQDKDRCFLDIVKINAPKGAVPTVTYRLHCI